MTLTLLQKTFTPSNITKWVSSVEHAWAGWRNTVTNPEHMAAVDLVREILSSDNEDWKSWSYSFATQQGDKPYTVADLMEKVVNQDKLLNAGGTKKKATAQATCWSWSQSPLIQVKER